MSTTWDYDREMAWHTRPVSPGSDVFVFVYKTPAGDYAVSAMTEGDASGGQVEYEPTLQKAKRLADDLCTSGAYVNYLVDQPQKE